jgi:hypothetical protein
MKLVISRPVTRHVMDLPPFPAGRIQRPRDPEVEESPLINPTSQYMIYSTSYGGWLVGRFTMAPFHQWVLHTMSHGIQIDMLTGPLWELFDL